MNQQLALKEWHGLVNNIKVMTIEAFIVKHHDTPLQAKFERKHQPTSSLIHYIGIAKQKGGFPTVDQKLNDPL